MLIITCLTKKVKKTIASYDKFKALEENVRTIHTFVITLLLDEFLYICYNIFKKNRGGVTITNKFIGNDVSTPENVI